MISTSIVSCKNEVSWGMGIPGASFTSFYKIRKNKLQTIEVLALKPDHCFRKMKSSNFYRNTYPTCTKEQQAQNKLLHMKDNSALFSIMQFTKDLKKSEVSGLLVILSIHSICSLTLMVITELV